MHIWLLSRFWLAFLAFAVLSPWHAAQAEPQFFIKPYLFSILGQKIAVAWEYAPGTLIRGVPSVQLFNGSQQVANLPAEYETGLNYAILSLPACGYGQGITYRVSGQSALTPIEEIPCGDSANPVRFSFLADSQEGPKYAREFAEQIRLFPASAVLHGGDIVQTGDNLAEWASYFSAMDPVGGSRVLFPAVGNHEYRGDPAVPLWKHFFRYEAKEAHYAFDVGAARIVVLNSDFEDDPSQRTSQLEWLRAELAIPARWKIVYFHHPGYSIGFFNNPIAPKKEHVVVQDYYIPLFERYKVDLVMNGHVHLFEKDYKNGIYYLIVGPAGGKMGVVGAKDPYMLKAARERSIVNLEVSPSYLRALSVNIDGEVLDDLILRK